MYFDLAMFLIYLDAGTINHIADGKCPPEQVADLHAAMREVGASLILSLAHVWDFCNNTDDATKQRVATAIDAFPSRMLIADSPEATEREALDRIGDGAEFDADTYAPPHWQGRLFQARDFMRVCEPKVMDAADRFITCVRALTEAHRLGVQARRASTSGPSAQKQERDAVRAFLEGLFAAQNDEEIKALVEMRLASLSPEARAASDKMLKDGFEKGIAMFPPEVREQMPQWSLDLFCRAVMQTRRDAETHGITPGRAVQLAVKQPALNSVNWAGARIRGGMDRWYEIAGAVAPGMAIRVKIIEQNTGNAMRNPLHSDTADTIHVLYLPYMDLSVVDANNFSAYQSLQSKVRPRRKGVVVKDPGRDLRPLIQRIRSLPIDP